MIKIETKICTNCKKEKPVEDFNKNKATNTGLDYQCRECKNNYKRSYRERKKSGKIKKNKFECEVGYKICHSCLKKLPANYEYFTYSKNTKDNFSYNCKKCTSNKAKERRINKNFKNKYTVYMHVNKINNKKYIGLTKQQVKDRWLNGEGYSSQSLFYNDIKEYGWDNFEHIVIYEGLTKEEGENLEVSTIAKFNTTDINMGYNIQIGGNNSKKGLRSSIAKRVICGGVIYDSVKECADFYNVTRTKLSNYLNGKCTTPEFFLKLNLCYADEESKIRPRIITNKKVICDNKIFDTVKQCSDFYNIKSHTMANWVKGNNSMPQNFIDLGLRYYEEKEIPEISLYKKNTKGHPERVICDNIKYNSITDCAKYYNVKYGTMVNWLNGKFNMPQNFIDMNLKYIDKNMEYKSQSEHLKTRKSNRCKKVICDNIIYDSIKDCSEFYSIHKTKMGNWLRGRNKMPQEFQNKGLSYYKN